MRYKGDTIWLVVGFMLGAVLAAGIMTWVRL